MCGGVRSIVWEALRPGVPAGSAWRTGLVVRSAGAPALEVQIR